MPGAKRTYRKAVANDSKKFSRGSLDWRCRGRQVSKAPNISRKQAELAANTQLAPKNGNKRPPKAGPIIPDMFNCSPLSVDAEGNSSSETTSGTMAVQVGALKAKPTPVKKTAVRMT